MFVAVGWDGVIVTSPDGVDWSYQDVYLDGQLCREGVTAVAWAGPHWVAVDANGGAVLSADGV